MTELRIGDWCRIEGSTPARYIGHSLAIGVFILGDYRIGRATPITDGASVSHLPYAEWDAVEAAATTVEHCVRNGWCHDD